MRQLLACLGVLLLGACSTQNNYYDSKDPCCVVVPVQVVVPAVAQPASGTARTSAAPSIPANAERKVNADNSITYTWCSKGLLGNDPKTREQGCWRW